MANQSDKLGGEEHKRLMAKTIEKLHEENMLVVLPVLSLVPMPAVLPMPMPVLAMLVLVALVLLVMLALVLLAIMLAAMILENWA